MNIFDIMVLFFLILSVFLWGKYKEDIASKNLLVENAVSKIIRKFTVTRNSFCLEMRWQDYTK